jgi:hypothetical protein
VERKKENLYDLSSINLHKTETILEEDEGGGGGGEDDEQ